MKSRSLIVIFVALACCATAGGQTRQKKPQPKSQPSASQPAAAQPSNEQMQREMQNAAPSASHAALAKLAGEYLTASRFTAPGAAPMESGGDARLSMTLDGRFLVEEDTGSFAGQPSKSFKMLGYNNASKRYEGIWTYTMSTAIMTLNGVSADGGRTISFNASWDDEGGAKRNLQIVMRQIDDDHFVVELSEKSADGKPGPVLTTTYSRKEKPTFGG